MAAKKIITVSWGSAVVLRGDEEEGEEEGDYEDEGHDVDHFAPVHSLTISIVNHKTNKKPFLASDTVSHRQQSKKE